jgi:hypothetical protein
MVQQLEQAQLRRRFPTRFLTDRHRIDDAVVIGVSAARIVIEKTISEQIEHPAFAELSGERAG